MPESETPEVSQILSCSGRVLESRWNSRITEVAQVYRIGGVEQSTGSVLGNTAVCR